MSDPQSTQPANPSPATTPASQASSVAGDVARTATDAGAVARDLSAQRLAAAIGDAEKLRTDLSTLARDVRASVKGVRWFALGGAAVGSVLLKVFASAHVLAALGGPAACTPAQRQVASADAAKVEAYGVRLEQLVCIVAHETQPSGDVALACNVADTVVQQVRADVARERVNAAALDAATRE